MLIETDWDGKRCLVSETDKATAREARRHSTAAAPIPTPIPALVLRSYCAHAALMLRLYCSHTAPMPRLYCASAHILLSYFAYSPLYCACAALILRLCCAYNAMILRAYCVHTARQASALPAARMQHAPELHLRSTLRARRGAQ